LEAERDGEAPEALRARAVELSEQRRAALGEWEIGEPELGAYAAGTAVRVLTPSASAGEPLHMLSSLERVGGGGPRAASTCCSVCWPSGA
jgi:hypothetical protein